MKTAICISGHLRHYKNLKDNFQWFKKALQSFCDVDVFVASWDKQNTLASWSHAHVSEGHALQLYHSYVCNRGEAHIFLSLALSLSLSLSFSSAHWKKLANTNARLEGFNSQNTVLQAHGDVPRIRDVGASPYCTKVVVH